MTEDFQSEKKTGNSENQQPEGPPGTRLSGREYGAIGRGRKTKERPEILAERATTIRPEV
jgi:hypothetical protein